MPRQRMSAAVAFDSGISERSTEVTSGISSRAKRPRRCVVPKLLKLTLAQSEALNELAAEWGLSASDVLKRLLMNAYLERKERQ